MNVAIVDYGAGNVASVARAIAHVGGETAVTSRAGDLTEARAIVVPGVGHFSRTTAITSEMRSGVRRAVARGVPVLGICLGLHWLFDGSEEAPDVPGLGAFAGRCAPLVGSGAAKVPHVGWNVLDRGRASSLLLSGLGDRPHVYFCHSFAAPVTESSVASCAHGTVFPAVVEGGLTFGVQFHPEKSGDTGLGILKNFLRLSARLA